MLDNLLLGAATALSLANLIYAFTGVLLGNIIGVLPGIGPMAAIAMLLPITYNLDPTGGLIMLAGLYYGASFGGATTAILLNLPGTASHAVLCLEGHPLAQQGRGGQAIFMAMFASFVGVCVGIVLMMFFSPLLVDLAFLFGPAEYFALLLMGLFGAASLGADAPLKGIAAIFLGLLLGVVGTDINSGMPRFTFDIPELMDGLPLVALAMGLFGIKDVLANAGFMGSKAMVAGNIDSRSVRPEAGEIAGSAAAMARGSVIGSAVGILPGAGGPMAPFMSYMVEKKVSRNPERFGKGVMQGVSGPEAANSSGVITAFIPTLTLGIPGDAVMALIVGALTIHNIIPGPQLLAEHPNLFWGLIVSFWVGNIMLMVLNIPLIKVWVKLLSVPYRLIYPIVMFLIAVGVYSGNNSLFDVGVVAALGVMGYLLAGLGFPPAPLLLGFVLGPMVEDNFRRALQLSHGDISIFLTRPLSAGFLLLTLVMLVYISIQSLRRRASTW